MSVPIRIKTNLDLRNESWPDSLPGVPRVGDHVLSNTKRGEFRLALKVVRVTWAEDAVEVELHMTDWQRGLPAPPDVPDAENGSMYAFYDWYARVVGTSRHAFI